MKLTPEAATRGINKLGLMAFFPSDPDTRAALVWVLMELVETEEQLDWLVGRALKCFSKWPGIAELRALYCSRFRPKDGVEAYSEVYPRGFPHESPEPAKPPGRAATMDHEFERRLRELAKVKQMLPPGRKP